jgi:hypothetical protein
MNLYAELVEWHWQNKSKILEETPVPVLFAPPQIPYGRPVVSNPEFISEKAATNRLGYIAAPTGECCTGR